MSRWGRYCHFVFVLFALLAPVLATAEPLAVIPFDLISSRAVIPVSINGSPPLNFVFDNASGGTILHSATAEALGIGGAPPLIIGGGVAVSEDAIAVPEGAIVVEGDGMQITEGDTTLAVGFVAGSSGMVMSGQSSTADVSLGGLALTDVELSMLPLTHITMPSGEPIDGIIGYDILKAHVVEVDNDAGELRVFDRDTYVPSDGATAHEVTHIFGNVAQPCVSGELLLPGGESVSGMFVLDAGAGAHVVFNTPFVREHGLVEKLGGADAATSMAKGVTPDETPTVSGTVERFTFCGFVVDDVPVTMNQGTTGFLASEGYAGVIGNRVLSGYNIAYDYAGGVVYLEPLGAR